MGYWKLETWKKDSQGEEVDLDEVDWAHIADQIRQGCTEGEVVDS